MSYCALLEAKSIPVFGRHHLTCQPFLRSSREFQRARAMTERVREMRMEKSGAGASSFLPFSLFLFPSAMAGSQAVSSPTHQ